MHFLTEGCLLLPESLKRLLQGHLSLQQNSLVKVVTLQLLAHLLHLLRVFLGLFHKLGHFAFPLLPLNGKLLLLSLQALPVVLHSLLQQLQLAPVLLELSLKQRQLANLPVLLLNIDCALLNAAEGGLLLPLHLLVLLQEILYLQFLSLDFEHL